jgi:hypothetical protein
MHADIASFEISLTRRWVQGGSTSSTVVFDSASYETVQEAKRIICASLDALLDARSDESSLTTAGEQLASAERRLRGITRA